MYFISAHNPNCKMKYAENQVHRCYGKGNTGIHGITVKQFFRISNYRDSNNFISPQQIVFDPVLPAAVGKYNSQVIFPPRLEGPCGNYLQKASPPDGFKGINFPH